MSELRTASESKTVPESPRNSPVREGSILLRSARRSDAAAIEQLVSRSGVLDHNSCYAYLLLCTHFADSCVVAERGDAIVGFVTAYRPPGKPRSLFVWQVAVDASARGQGLGLRLLKHLVTQPTCQDIVAIQATVSPSNLASRRLFESFARHQRARCVEETGFEPADFGKDSHEAEPLLVIDWSAPTPTPHVSFTGNS